MPNTEMGARLAYTVEETADLIGVSIMTVYRMVENGTLPYKRIEGRGKKGQGRIIIPVVALSKWLSQADVPRNVAMQRKARDIAKTAVSKIRGSRSR
ncbi:MAG: Helix-turn-helix domain protein [Pelotomaculum sp. PtaU1.Bin065]|nr:MAG: Helix-turn-helix domain protein [Pelotomaculum sp. PtaU1.Bin065]